MSSKSTFPGRLGIQQRVIPSYRIEFFDLLAESCSGGLSIFAGDVRDDESIPTTGELRVAEYKKASNLHFQDIQSTYYFLWQSGFIEWLEDWDPEILIVEANPRYLSTFLAIRWMHKRGRSVIGWGLGAPVTTSQRIVAGSINGWFKNFLWKQLLNGLDALIAYSHKGAGEYKTQIDPEKQVFVAVNSVAGKPIGPPHNRSPQFTGSPIVLYVGRLQPRKNLDNLIRACSYIPDDLQPKLVIVGDGPERGILEELSNQVYPDTRFFGRRIGSELTEIFHMADLFVLPGTGGLAVQEAMSYALPVIVAEGDGTQEDLVSEDNGWLIPSDDELALFETLKFALSDPIRLRKMGQSSYKIVQDEVNIERMVEVFIEALDKTSKLGRT